MISIGEGQLAIPPAWRNSSVNIFSPDTPGGLSLTVTRADLPRGQTLADYVAAQINSLQAQLPQLQVLQDERLQLAAAPAQQIEIQWKSAEHGPMHQIVLAVLQNGLIMNLTASHAGVMEHATREQALACLHSFRFFPPEA